MGWGRAGLRKARAQTTTRAHNVRRTAGRPESPRMSMAGTYPPGNGRPCAVLERRADLQFYWPVASGELQAPAKLRPVDRVSGSQFVRSLRRSRVRAEYRARGARPASSDRVNRPPGAHWAPHAASPPAARQLPRGQRRWPHRSGEPHSERARARAMPCRLTAGASRPSRGEAAAVELENPIGTRSHLLGGGWRAA